jgi:hypothetical protein
MKIDSSDEQVANASASIRRSLEPGSKLTDLSDLQPSKHFFPITSTDAGRQIDLSTEQNVNASSSRTVSLDPDSNVMVTREEQPFR